MEFIKYSLPYIIMLIAWAIRLEIKMSGLQKDISWIIKTLNNKT